MKKTIYLLVAFLLCLTSCVEPLSPNDLRPKANETGLVAVTMQLTIPQAELSVGTKANTFSHKPQIESIHAALFGTSGYPQAYSLAEPVGTFATENATIYTFKVLLPVYDGEAHVHIIANGPESIQFSEQTEYSIMSQMSTTNQVGAYWARVVLPNGILPIKDENGIMTTDENGNFIANDETIAKFRDLTLVRNFAEIKLIVAQGAGISNVSWTLVNDLTYGAVAPFNQDSVVIGDYKTPFIDNYKDYTFDEGTGKMVLTSTNPNVIYDGYAVSSDVNYNVTDNMAFPKAVGDSVWCYERPDPNKTNPTFILIKANFDADGSGDTCYYRLDLMDESLGGYFPIYRNYKYQIKIDHVGNKGASSPTQAALRNSNGNMSMSAETKTLTDVSDGISRLYIEFVEKTYTNPRDTTTSFWVYYVPDITDVDGNGNPKIDNTLINVGVKQTAVNTALANNSITLDESKSQATGVVNATTGVASAMYFYKFNLKGQTTTDLQSVIEVVADNGLSGADHSTLYRDVTVRVMKIMDMNLSMAPNKLEEGVHTDSDPRLTVLHIALTDTLQQSMFPLEFYIEDTNRTLNPTGKDGNGKAITVPVKLGTSLYDEDNTESYYFIRTVQWSEYEPMRDAWVQAKNDHMSTDGIIDFTTEFKAIKAQSATTLYVDNDYFNMESVSLSNGGIRLSADQTTVARTATSATVHVEADDDVSWEASVDNGASLVVTRAVGPYSGSHDLSISFDQNNTFSPKEYTVTVTSGSKNYQIAITQKGRSFSVSPSSQEINYYQNSAQITVTADSDLPWTVSVNNGASVSADSGTGTQTVTVSLPFNYSTTARNYTLTVTPNNTTSAQVTTTISQTRVPNTVSNTSFRYDAFGNFNGTGSADNGNNNNRITVALANCRKQNGNNYIVTYYNNNYGTITVTPGSNRRITGVVITYSGNNYVDNGATVSAGSVSGLGTTTVTWGVTAESAITYTSSSQTARITNIQVYYENR